MRVSFEEVEAMGKVANLRDVQKGESLRFEHEGQNAILIRTAKDELFAYIAVCPHEGGNLEWDQQIHRILCECHMSLFNVSDGSVYRHSSLFELNQGLTRIDIKVDEDGNIHTA